MTSLSADPAQRNHRRAIRFFWWFLGVATLVSLAGNISHAVLPHLSLTAIQIGAAAVPPIVLLAAVHGVALAVRAGASGAVYRCAISAVVLIGIGAFALSFIALRDLMLAIEYSQTIAWIFPAIIDTAVAVATLMLVALGDKPAHQTTATGQRPTAVQGVPAPKTGTASATATATASRTASTPRTAPATRAARAPAALRTAPAGLGRSAVARALVDAGETTKSVDEVEQVLAAYAAGTAITRIASDTGMHHKTVQRIINAANQQQQLASVG